MQYLLSHWLDMPCDDSAQDESDWCYGADLNKDGKVNLGDMAILARHWLQDFYP